MAFSPRLSQMPVSLVFERAFRRIYGKPCWGTRVGYGLMLDMHFGRPHLEVREPMVASKDCSARVRESLARRGLYVHGEWHLWIYSCNWEIFSKGKRIGDNSTERSACRAAAFLKGEKLTRLSISPRKVECAFEFDLGATLRTRPDNKGSDQWLLFINLPHSDVPVDKRYPAKASHRVLTLRGDGFYSYHHPDLSPGLQRWKPISI